MTKKFEADVLPARAMKPIGDRRWFAQVRVRHVGAGNRSDFIRIPGEWHGRTREEAESKARRAAEEWIARHSD